MVELARTTRSGIVEARHDGAAVAVSANGSIVAVWGDPSERTLYRSAIKPFQAIVSQRHGAALVPEQMAVACASHSAHAVQIELVRGMLDETGLSEQDLGCPPELPALSESRMTLARHGAAQPRRIFHNCSGKHSAFLRACVASGWPVGSYLDPDHPLQRRVLSLITEATGESPAPVAVDGCGAPAPSGTLVGLATAFARLSTDPDYGEAATAMSRYPSLVSSNLTADGRLAAWWHGPLKRGAQGIVAAGRHGLGVAVKSREGRTSIAVVGLIAVMKHLGLLSDAALSDLTDVASPIVYGGGRAVGALEPALGT